MKIIAVFFTVICVLVVGILCQLSTYQSRYRPDCEYKQCMKPIRQHGNCPRWGSCQWYCQAKLANCTVGTRYHCARDLRNLEQFTSACAVEIFCLSGEEPYLSVQESTGKATVNCRPCYKKNVYNSRHNTSSATFSECHMLKKNLCKKQDNKIDCGNQNYTELTMTDGYCRCDARNGYAARSQKMCFYEYEVCFVKKCPEGMELLLNYTCGMLCPTGYTRQPESDICTEVSLTRPFSSDRPELNLTDVQTTSIRTLDAPSTNEQLYKQIIIPICLSMVVFVFVIVTILFRRQLKGSKSQITNDTGGKATANRDKTYPANATASPAIPMDRDSGASFTATAVTEPSDSPGVGPMKDKGESTPTAIETPENKNTSEEIPLQTIGPNVEKPENLALNSTISNPEMLKIVTDHFGKGVPDTDTQTKITSGKTVPDSHTPREAQRSESQITNDTDGKATANRENTSPADATASLRDKPLHDISTTESDSKGLLGQVLCEGIYTFLKKENVFEESKCLDMINAANLFEFDKLKEKDIIKPDTTRTIKTIKVEGFTAYEMPGKEISCMYEFMSYLLVENADMKYIIRLAAMRYALQNFGTYVNKLTGEFSSKVNDAKSFFEIHSISFKQTGSPSMEKCVRNSFTDLVREIANTGQGPYPGPFYVEFLRGALNCKIKQFTEWGLYKRGFSKVPGFNVTLTTNSPPERELHIYRVKTVSGHGGLSNNYKIVPLLKNENRQVHSIK